jgi:hypothetical protein
MTKFIVLAGKKQVGKDTSAAFITEMLVSRGVSAKIVHFADILKDTCSVLFGIPRAWMETEEGKERQSGVPWPTQYTYVPEHTWLADKNGTKPLHKVWVAGAPVQGKPMTVREVLQFVGTDLFRNQLDPDVWARSVFNQTYKEDVVIVADCRFPNEARFGNLNGIVVKINRQSNTKDAHASETALDSYTAYNAIVDNNGSLDALYQSWRELLVKYKFITCE